MRNGRAGDSRRERRKRGETVENCLKEVPNQALYQAEPQPELIVSPARQRSARPYFAYFEPPGKKLSQATLCKIGRTRQI
jgi:hypothetical protein